MPGRRDTLLYHAPRSGKGVSVAATPSPKNRAYTFQRTRLKPPTTLTGGLRSFRRLRFLFRLQRSLRSDVPGDSIFHVGSVPLLWLIGGDPLEVGRLSA